MRIRRSPLFWIVLTLLLGYWTPLWAVSPNIGEVYKDGATILTGSVRGVLGGVFTLLRVVGGVVGLIGATQVYAKWSNGERHIKRTVAMWVGGTLFWFLSTVALEKTLGVSYIP